MPELLAPEDLPVHVPGKILARSDGLGWQGVSLRTYAYEGQDVEVPAMRDYLLVSYRAGVTQMQRRFDGRWSYATCQPGAVSLLTRSQKSHWHWTEKVEVTHVYLSLPFVVAVADEVSGRSVRHIELADVLRTDDPVMTAAVAAISQQVLEGGIGGELYVDSVARQLVIHLLRKYAAIGFQVRESTGAFSAAQRNRTLEFIEENMHRRLDLGEMARNVNMSTCTFSRYFRRTLGMPPYAFVMNCRLERARQLLSAGSVPPKKIALICGFSDQAHLTRLFSRAYGATPSAYRKCSSP